MPADTTPTAPPTITIRDVAARLQLTVDTVYELIREKRIPPPLALSGRFRWHREGFDRWLAAQQEGVPAEGGSAK